MPGSEELTARAGRAHWWRAFAIITAAFVSGLVAGGAGATAYFFKAGFPPPGGPMMDPATVMEYLRDELKLAPEKEGAVRAIFRRHHAEFMAFHREATPRMHALFERLREEVAAELTPEQAKQWRAQFEVSRQRSLPFRKMLWLADGNDDGLVDREEMASGFPGVNMEWFSRADANQDGLLDKGEIKGAQEDPELDGFGPP